MENKMRNKVPLVVALLLPLALTQMAIATPERAASFFGFGDGTGSQMGADAWRGLKSIFKGEDFSYGLPVKIFNRTAKQQHLDRATEWRVFGNLPSPTWRAAPYVTAPLPLGESVFVRSGAAVMNQNCFACHAGLVAGQVVAGLGNMQVDAVSFKTQADELVQKWDRPLGRFELSLLLNRTEMDLLEGYVDYLRSILLPSIQAKGRGDIHGPWAIWRLISRMKDPAKSLDLYPPDEKAPLESLLDRQLPPVRPNPWWRLKYKKRAFWTADVSVHSLPTFALNLMDPNENNTETFPARMERTRLQLEFARQTEAPPFPSRRQVNRVVSLDGWALFHGKKPLADGTTLKCFGCHGNYSNEGKLEFYPNLDAVDIQTIRTDPAYATILHDIKPLYEHFGESPFAPTGIDAVHYPEQIGYVPPPLVGIWASAPYFHNGSVPSVYEVLKSSARPTLWRKNLDILAYDKEKLGVSRFDITAAEYATLKYNAWMDQDPMSSAALAVRQVYDTQDFGKSNTGHPFGDAMTDAERMAVIEYLKLL